MKNSDDAIDRALAALRETEIPEGMERRILHVMRHNSSERRRSGSIRLRMPLLLGGTPYRAIALASAAIVATLIFWAVSRPHAFNHTAPAEETHSAHATSPALSHFEETPAAPEPSTQASTATAQQRTSPQKVKSTPQKRLLVLRYDVGSTNHPAPEAPLTEQEKLLLRIAHRSDPQEIAGLNPSLWAARDAKDKEEVKRFFEPPSGDDQ
jgi:hypothetical protein